MTAYPKPSATVSFADGTRHIDADNQGVEQLHIVVKKSFDEIMRNYLYFCSWGLEGFTKVKFEHKQPGQIGSGLNLKLKKPWEMHVTSTSRPQKGINRNPCRGRGLEGLFTAPILTENASSFVCPMR